MRPVSGLLCTGGRYAPTIAWSPDENGTTIDLSMEVHRTFSMAVGGPPQPYPLTWHPALRYFRMSQTTGDLYDGFRNLYLGRESLLSSTTPVNLKANGKPDEGEAVWLKRAPRAGGRRSAGMEPSHGPASYLDALAVSGADPVEACFRELYTDLRTKVFHAKNGRPVALPQGAIEQAAVQSGLDCYGRLLTDLAELHLGARLLRSGIGDSFAKDLANTTLPCWQVGLLGRTFATVELFEAE